jgi:hypothetical protein
MALSYAGALVGEDWAAARAPVSPWKTCHSHGKTMCCAVASLPTATERGTGFLFDRVADIVIEVIDSGDWQEEQEDFYDDEEELGAEIRQIRRLA